MIDGYTVTLAAGYILLVGLFALFFRYAKKSKQWEEELDEWADRRRNVKEVFERREGDI